MIQKYMNICNTIIKWIAVCLIAFLASIMCANVFCRYALRFSLTWVAEVARFSMVWAAFLSAVVLVNSNEHLRMDILLQNVRGRINTVLQTIVYAGSCFLFIVFSVAGFLLVRGTGNQVASSVPIPMNVVYLIIPISGLLMAFGSIGRIIILFTEKPEIPERNIP